MGWKQGKHRLKVLPDPSPGAGRGRCSLFAFLEKKIWYFLPLLGHVNRINYNFFKKDSGNMTGTYAEGGRKIYGKITSEIQTKGRWKDRSPVYD